VLGVPTHRPPACLDPRDLVSATVWVQVDGAAIVVRFDPMRNVAKMAEHAETSRRLTGVAGLSVYADIQGPGEAAEDTEGRLLLVAARRINPDRNRFYYVCTAQALLDQRFAFHKDETDDEADEHYTVAIGAADESACTQFSKLFRRKPWR
jgi:hypothetical protein